ncbi:MAG: branched-chain amino acid ABC transporter permease [Acidimicrobiia bacterium]|nr:branched-chain amino acid ABC transporter permease [Acidimicrobiia bacterium]
MGRSSRSGPRDPNGSRSSQLLDGTSSEPIDVEIWLQVLINGVLLGGLYGLVATGLALVFGVMGIINVAHGDLMVVGATGTFLLFSTWGLPPYVGILAIIPVMFVMGLGIQRFLLERINRAEELMSLLLLFGLGIAISQSTASLVGAEFFSVPYWSGAISIGPLFASRSLLYAFLLAIAVASALFYLLAKTPSGRAIRATAMAPDLAASVGIDVRWVRMLTFGVGTVLTGIAGGLMVTTQGLNPLSGEVFLLIAFAACVLGGLGSLYGALTAGIIIGVIEVSTAILIDTQSSQLAIYIIFIIMLLVRPTGIFGMRRA